MCKNIILAWLGYHIWLGLKRKYNIGEDIYFIIMPEDDKELNINSMHHIGAFLKRKYMRGAIVLTLANKIDYSMTENYSKVIKIVRRPAFVIKLLLKYYCLIQFKEHIIVVSFNEPYGNRGLLKKEGVTMEYLTSIYFFGI